jgi:hypothetical protein
MELDSSGVLYRRHPGFDFTQTILDYGLWALIPISLRWWLVCTRKCVKAQFGRVAIPLKKFNS